MEDYLLKHSGEEIDALLDKVEGLVEDTSDLDTIRENAQKGATALQSVPEEYITEKELKTKRYVTITQLEDTLTGKQDTIDDLDTIREGASKGKTSVQVIRLNSVNSVPSDDGIVDLGNIGGGGGNVSFIDNNSLQGLPFGYIGGYYRSYEFDGVSIEEVNLGYIDNYYYDTIAIAYNDVLYEERISRLMGDGKVLGTVVVRVDDSYNLYVKQFALKKTTFGWRIYTDKQLMPDSWVNLESYYTKTEVNDALIDKVDKVEGKGLSTEDFTTALKNKVETTTDIIASQIFLELHSSSDDFQVFSHKRGYEEHNRKVCQRLIENCFTNKTPNNEMFFVTINGLRNGVPYMETAILEGQGAEIVRASFVKGTPSQSSQIAASIDILSIDVENLRSYAESGDNLFYWRYSSIKVPSIGATGSEGESDVYVTEFTFEQVTKNGTIVTVSRAFVDAVYSKKIILVPYRTAYMVAYSARADTPEKITSVDIRFFFGGIDYISTLSGSTIPTGGTGTIQVRVTTTTYISGTLSSINGASLLSGSNILLTGAIVVNGDTFTPDAKGVVDLGNISGDINIEDLEEVLAPRNLGVVDTTSEVDDTIPFATTDYVNDAIASAITLTINADY